jgi:hypothetical protein
VREETPTIQQKVLRDWHRASHTKRWKKCADNKGKCGKIVSLFYGYADYICKFHYHCNYNFRCHYFRRSYILHSL